MTACRIALALAALLGMGAVAMPAPYHAKKAPHRHLVRRQPLPRPMLATVAYQGTGVPYTATAPAPGLDQVGVFSTSFLGDLVLAATVPAPQPQCMPRQAVSQKTEDRPPWNSVGPVPIYCEIAGP